MSALTTPAVAHTPGPWHLMEKGFSEKRDCPTVYATDDHLRYIAFCSDFGSGTDNLANARLIAAAPDLLAALKDAEALMATMDSLRHISASFPQLDNARAALAKAGAL